MRSFDGTDPIQLLPFLKDIRITFNSQHLTEGVAVRFLAHFLERDAERLYTSYTMRGLRAGQLHDDVSWPGLVNQFLKRYLTGDVLGEAYDAVETARQQSYETESTFADRLETAPVRCTAVLSEQSLAHYFVPGLAPATRTAVSETVQRLPSRQKTDLPTIRRIATAEGTTYRARRRLPLPDSKPAGRASRTTKSAATSSPALALHIGEDGWQTDPVLITPGPGHMGERLPTPVSSGSTGTFTTALERTPRSTKSTDPRVAELKISHREGGGATPRVPTFPTRRHHKQRSSPREMVARTCAGYILRTAIPFMHARSRRLSNVCSRRTGTTATRCSRAPEYAVSFGSWLASAVHRVKFTRIVRVVPHVSPHDEAGTVRTSSIIVIDAMSVKWMYSIRAKMDDETGSDPGFPRGYRTRSCTSRIRQSIRILCPRMNAEQPRR